MPQTVHVYPNNDLIEHDTDGGDCPCGPIPEPVFDADYLKLVEFLTAPD